MFVKLRDYLSILVLLAFPVVILFFQYSWLDANQAAFHLPLIVATWCIFRNRILIWQLAILTVVSYLIAELGLIDEMLFDFIKGNNLFPSYVVHNGFVNPQYTKILLYNAVLAVLGVKVLFKRYRTAESFFVFVSALACLVVTLVIHKAIPGTTLVWDRAMASKNMHSIVSASYANEPVAQLLCAHFKLKCSFNLTSEQVLAQVKDENFKKRFAEIDKLKAHGYIFKEVLESGEFHDETWYRQFIGVVELKPKFYAIMIEEELINQSQKISENAFSQLATYANLVWGWLFILVGLFHTNSARKKLFKQES